MKRIVWDEPERVMRFVAERTQEENGYPLYTAIGLEKNGQLVAGAVFNMHSGVNVMGHLASDGSKHWMTPAYLAACFRYAFVQLGCERITGLVRSDNIDAQRLDEHLGFKREGVLRKATPDGKDMFLYGLLKEECRFLEGKYHAALLANIRHA